MGEVAGIGVHCSGAVAKSFQDGVDCLPLLSCGNQITAHRYVIIKVSDHKVKGTGTGAAAVRPKETAPTLTALSLIQSKLYEKILSS